MTCSGEPDNISMHKTPHGEGAHDGMESADRLMLKALKLTNENSSKFNKPEPPSSRRDRYASLFLRDVGASGIGYMDLLNKTARHPLCPPSSAQEHPRLLPSFPIFRSSTFHSSPACICMPRTPERLRPVWRRRGRCRGRSYSMSKPRSLVLWLWWRGRDRRPRGGKRVSE